MCLKQRADSLYALAQRLVTGSPRDRITLLNVLLPEPSQHVGAPYGRAQRLVTRSERDRITLFNVSLQEFCQGVGSLNGQAQSTIGGDEPLMDMV
jgi:hypothetical protein